MSNGDPNIFCRTCGVFGDAKVKCDGCDEEVPHDELVHYDAGMGGPAVYCQTCDEWIEEETEEEL
jgi:hypothetical protein